MKCTFAISQPGSAPRCRTATSEVRVEAGEAAELAELLSFRIWRASRSCSSARTLGSTVGNDIFCALTRCAVLTKSYAATCRFACIFR